ncbi:MAG: hypothetical protein HYX41_07035 [Bdellovibrio sp.]|nr:hypothetical protein [Bdellovibrio sp.]
MFRTFIVGLVLLNFLGLDQIQAATFTFSTGKKGRAPRITVSDETVALMKEGSTFISLREETIEDADEHQLLQTILEKIDLMAFKTFVKYQESAAPWGVATGLVPRLRILHVASYLGIESLTNRAVDLVSEILFDSKRMAYFESKAALDVYLGHVHFTRGISRPIVSRLAIPADLNQALTAVIPEYLKTLGFLELQIANFLITHRQMVTGFKIPHLVPLINQSPILLTLYQSIIPIENDPEYVQKPGAKRPREFSLFELRYGRAPETPYEILFNEIEPN